MQKQKISDNLKSQGILVWTLQSHIPRPPLDSLRQSNHHVPHHFLIASNENGNAEHIDEDENDDHHRDISLNSTNWQKRCSLPSVSDSDPLGWVAGADLLLVWLTWDISFQLESRNFLFWSRNCLPLHQKISTNNNLPTTLPELWGPGTAPSVSSLCAVIAVDWELA